MRCPACKMTSLKTFRDNSIGLEIDSCPSCSGVWFDAHELAGFLKSDAMRQRFLWMDGSEPLTGVGYVINTRARICPRDNTAMGEKIFGGITIDWCSQCKGLWFDDGEVRLIVERYKRGETRGDREVAREVRDGLDDRQAGDGKGAVTALIEFIRGLVHKQ